MVFILQSDLVMTVVDLFDGVDICLLFQISINTSRQYFSGDNSNYGTLNSCH